MLLRVIAAVLEIVVVLFLIFLLARAVLDWVQVFAREWRPRGGALVAAEIVYSVTDPPLKALRRVIPPVRLGNVNLDVAYMVLFAICWLLLIVLP